MIVHPYADFLKQVEKPGRYLGGEFGARKAAPDASVRMVLSYPDTYEIGMSHIGLGVLYDTVNATPEVSCERVFMPWGDMEKALRERGLPLVSLESATPLSEFDVVGFSLQYELTYTNLVAMLELGRIPRRSEQRGPQDPLVIVGGPLAAHSEPIAPFVDVVVLGDGEESLPMLLREVLRCKAAGRDRPALLAAMDALPFAYVPGMHRRARINDSGRWVVGETPRKLAKWATVKHLGQHRTGGTISPNVETVFDRFSLEVARGCSGGCRFCQAGFLYRPIRERDEREVAEAVSNAVRCTGFDAVSLASLSTADHSRVVPMLAELGETFTPKRVSFFVPSLRAYGLDASVVEVLSRLRATGVTLAPEAGSQRLRDVINKNITEADLMVAAARFFDWGLMRIKLYFMIGLPTETDADIEAIVDLATRLRDFGRRRLRGRTPIITVSASTFVPKPFTPFAGESMLDTDDILRRQQMLYDLGRRQKLEIRTHSEPLSRLEGVLCRGDVSLAPVIEKAVDLGARFDGWSEQFRGDIWDTVLSEVDQRALLGPIAEGDRTSWDHVAAGVDDTFLEKERRRAAVARTTEPCGRFTTDVADKDRFVCHHCGVACVRESVPLRAPREAAMPDSLPAPKPQKKGKPLPRTIDSQKNIQPSRVILYLSKWGRQVFVGHLDTIRQVMRALRRAGLDIYYTQGFNPKPKLSSAPPLPLGTAAMADPIEVYLVHPPTAAEILERLNRAVPEDMAFVRAEILPREGRSLSKRLIDARFIALLNADRDTVLSGRDRVLNAGAIIVSRTRKGHVSEVDVRPYIREIELLDALPEGVPLPVDSTRIPISFSLYLPGSGGCKPSELLREMVGPLSSDAWVVRREIALEPAR